MKRDLDLIREIMLQIEASTKCGARIEISGRDVAEVRAHVELLEEAGFVTACTEEFIAVPMGPQGLKPTSTKRRTGEHRLTWAGYEFLEMARSATRWGRLQAVAKGMGGVAVSVGKDLLLEWMKREAGLTG